MIETKPQWSGRGFFWVAVAGLLFSVIGAIPIMLLIDYFYVNAPYSKPPVPLMICTFIPGFLFFLWYSRNLRNRHRWQLTDTELIGGVSGQQGFPLASIKKVIVGLPTETFIPAVGKVLDQDEPGSSTNTFLSVISAFIPQTGMVRQNYKIRTFQRERTLLLVFNDGSILPLFLLSASGGEALMAELESKLRDRLVFNYKYSLEEAHKLSMLEANVLIPAGKCPLKV